MEYGNISFNRLYFVQHFFEYVSLAYLIFLSEKIQSAFAKVRFFFSYLTVGYFYSSTFCSSKTINNGTDILNVVTYRKWHYINIQCPLPVLYYEKGQEMT
jgi:hypothetical protein